MTSSLALRLDVGVFAPINNPSLRVLLDGLAVHMAVRAEVECGEMEGDGWVETLVGSDWGSGPQDLRGPPYAIPMVRLHGRVRLLASTHPDFLNAPEVLWNGHHLLRKENQGCTRLGKTPS